MATQSAFPLFQLPYLAIEEILIRMPLLAQCYLSTTSNKTRLLMKSCLQRYYRLKLDFNFDQNDGFMQVINDKNMDCLVFEMNEVSTVKTWVEELTNVFNITCVSLHFTEQSCNFVLDVIGIVKSAQLKLRSVNVVSYTPNNKLFQRALDECRDVTELHIGCKTTPSFKYKNTSKQPSHVDMLRIFRASCVRGRDIANLFSNCKTITLLDCHWKHTDLNIFLKRWMDGSKLEYLELELPQDFRFDCAFKNIPIEPVNRVRIDRIDRQFRDGQCICIKQKNGVPGILYAVGRKRKMLVLTTNVEL